MASELYVKLLEQGVDAWNRWRAENSKGSPDLRSVDLTGAKLPNIDFANTDLSHSTLVNADLRDARLQEASLAYCDLTGAVLIEANLWNADFSGANLCRANLAETDLRVANLDGANCEYADFQGANLTGASLLNTNLRLATVGWTVFGDNDLQNVVGLETVDHLGPSTIGIDTLYQSEAHISEAFLQNAGVPDEFITHIPSLIASVKPIQFDSCFISYSHQDEEFAKRLHSAMRSVNLRVWFAPEDLEGGKKLHEQIFQAIQVHDRLLLALSEDSMKSEWVMTEIRRAKTVEREENRRKLFPLRLVGFETIQSWECFDADGGKDLAAEVREYYIPDFSNWKDYDSFELEFGKLLRDLRATENNSG